MSEDKKLCDRLGDLLSAIERLAFHAGVTSLENVASRSLSLDAIASLCALGDSLYREALPNVKVD